jgi:protocatechuate 3,4-dioxygenase beta subunit
MSTPAQTVGPYYVIGRVRRDDSRLASRAGAGAMQLVGAVFDGQGMGIGDGMIEIWDGSAPRSGTDSEGRFALRSPAGGAAGEAPLRRLSSRSATR